MAIAENTVVANYQQYRGITETSPIYQYDYGQKLVLSGFYGLPEVFEVHFSSNQRSGEAVTVIGKDAEVDIPDILLQKGMDIWCWLYLHAGPNDGVTAYTIKIPVIRRPGISIDPPTPVEQNVIEQAIAAINDCTRRVEEAARIAEQYAGDHILYDQILNGEVVWDDGDASEYITEDEPEEEEVTGDG